MSFLGDYSNPELESFSCVVKLKDSTSQKANAPALKGFMVVTEAKLKDMLSYVQQNDRSVVYIDLALWPARDVKYRYEGKTSLREQFDGIEESRALQPPVPNNEDMFRI